LLQVCIPPGKFNAHAAAPGRQCFWANEEAVEAGVGGLEGGLQPQGAQLLYDPQAGNGSF
jgi:hypothetical protein